MRMVTWSMTAPGVKIKALFIEEQKPALARGDAGAVGPADDFALGQAAAATLGVEHPPDQDFFIGFEG